MKNFSAAAILIVPVVLLCACGRPTDAAQPSVSVSVTDRADPLFQCIPFQAQYIRTGGNFEGEVHPQTRWIEDRAALDAYYKQNRDLYDLQRNGFSDAVQKYDDAFFEAHSLILVVLQEGSGSIRHRVREVSLQPSVLDSTPYRIEPVIERQIPEVGTCDMAQWHIFIEIDKAYADLGAQLQNAKICDTQ